MESTVKSKPTAAPTKKSPADTLVAQTDGKNDVELKEEELKKVSGGLIALLHKQK